MCCLLYHSCLQYTTVRLRHDNRPHPGSLRAHELGEHEKGATGSRNMRNPFLLSRARAARKGDEADTPGSGSMHSTAENEPSRSRPLNALPHR